MTDSPTSPRAPDGGLNRVLSRNIVELRERRLAERRAAGVEARAAAAITGFVGSMPFVYLHVVMVAAWVLVNLGVFSGVAPFDKSFVGLATVASVEGIFLTTFVLISQNYDAKVADQRAELDLQINLLAEHEVTRLISLMRALAAHQGLELEDGESLGELERDVSPGTVSDRIKS